MSSLSLAASNGHIEIVKILVMQGGIELFLQRDDNSQYCVIHACLKHRHDVIEFLFLALINLLADPSLSKMSQQQFTQKAVTESLSLCCSKFC